MSLGADFTKVLAMIANTKIQETRRNLAMDFCNRFH